MLAYQKFEILEKTFDCLRYRVYSMELQGLQISDHLDIPIYHCNEIRKLIGHINGKTIFEREFVNVFSKSSF